MNESSPEREEESEEKDSKVLKNLFINIDTFGIHLFLAHFRNNQFIQSL